MEQTKKKELVRVIKFVCFSTSAGLIEIGSFTLLTEFTGMPYAPRYLIALVLSVLWNFTMNRKFTFRSANNVPVAMLKVALFYAVFMPVTTFGGRFLVESLHWNDYLVTALNMGLNLTTEYLYDRYFVFCDSIDTNKVGGKA
ncbi:MAG: GtrA family protein [Lachnospiraceae bacterium]|nr:GtrA family protein [Lachnospiraceae bacterium]